MKYLVNFKPIEGEYLFEEFIPRVEIINIDNKVWDKFPVATISPLTDQKELYLNTEGELISRREAEELQKLIEGNSKVFKFSLSDEGRLIEDESGEIHTRLPIDVEVENLEYINGEIMMFVKEGNGDK